MGAASRSGRRDLPVLAVGVALGALALLLVAVGLAQLLGLPTCESVSGNIDGTGGSPCRDGFDVSSWPNESLVSFVAFVPVAVPAAVVLRVGWRRR